MLRRIVLGCLVLILAGSGFGYAQTQVNPPKKVKPAKIKTTKVKKLKPPKPPKPTALTPSEKAIQKANDKNVKQQRKAFEDQNQQQAKQFKEQQKAVKKAVKQAKYNQHAVNKSHAR
jgi:hypothetical protein